LGGAGENGQKATGGGKKWASQTVLFFFEIFGSTQGGEKDAGTATKVLFEMLPEMVPREPTPEPPIKNPRNRGNALTKKEGRPDQKTWDAWRQQGRERTTKKKMGVHHVVYGVGQGKENGGGGTRSRLFSKTHMVQRGFAVVLDEGKTGEQFKQSEWGVKTS